jgi:CRP-like cAMP-binding protein
MTVQGQPSARLWVILEGQALVSMDARPIRVAASGDLVGLGSMLKGAVSPETTIALSPIRAFEADARQLRQLMALRPVRARLMAAASPRRRSSAAG